MVGVLCCRSPRLTAPWQLMLPGATSPVETLTIGMLKQLDADGRGGEPATLIWNERDLASNETTRRSKTTSL